MALLRPAVLLLLLLIALPGWAQTPIRHCVSADGHPVFTDQPCASVQATPAPAASSSAPAPSLRPPALTCAATADELRGAAADAFASGDANRLAGLMLWAGYGEHAAVADIRALALLMRQPLVDIEAPASAASSGPAAAASAPPELVVHTVADDGSGATHATRFAIERHAGCLWLRQE